MTAYSYMDSLPQPINQGEVVRYFATRPQGTLLFSQATLLCTLWQCLEMEAHVESHPNAMSSKQPPIVTRPDVDHVLWLWVQKLNQKGEAVNGPMLMAKQEWFENAMHVPEDKRLCGAGWIHSFCPV